MRIGAWFGWRRHDGPVPGGISNWHESLAAVCRELKQQNHVTEQDFLQVGARLQDFLAQAKEISDGCSTLARLFSGEDAAQADHDLRSILERTQSVTGLAQSGRTALDQMFAGVMAIAGPLEHLHADMRSFRVLSTLIRIESARLANGGVGFELLADEVAKLAVDIEQNGGSVLSAARALGQILRQAMPGVAEFEARQRAELPRIRSQATESLRVLTSKRGRAAEVSARMAEEYGAVWRDIGELVNSLQVHDITRQQIEHVIEALAEAERESEGSALLRRICELQCAQLEQSKTAFLAAVSRIRESLGGIARHVSGMEEEISGLMGSAGEGNSSALNEMEQGFAGIRTALGGYAESRFALSTVADTVAEGVREMTGFVDTIEEIGLRMQRVALNANVKAIQIGENGAALGAVADGIQRLAADSTRQTEAASSGIGEVRDQSRNFSAEMAQSSQDFAGEMERTIAIFRSADERSGQLLPEVGTLSRRLANELEKVRNSIRADGMLAEVVDRALDRLAGIAAQVTTEPGSEHQEALQKLEERYTMHVERLVHEREVGSEAEPVPVAGGELGDNVELF
jgi:methyl-accepting chemotaxis protein